MAEPFIGQIMPIAFQFAPAYWAFCDGTSLLVNQNYVLFAVIGARFGGDGIKTFMLPDLQGRIPVGAGYNVPGLEPRFVGRAAGTETVTLTTSEMMQHTHPAIATESANVMDPTAAIWGGDASGTSPYYSSDTPHATNVLAPTIGFVGGSGGLTLPHENMPPVINLNYIIALDGIYPIRKN